MTRQRRPFDPADVAARVVDQRLAAPGSELQLVEYADPGNPRGEEQLMAPVHIHWADDEVWYLLDGALSVLLDDRVVTLDPGGAVTAVRGTRHTFWNPSAAPCRYLIATTPRVLALIDALHAGGYQGDMAAVFAAHESELLGWDLPDPLVRLRAGDEP